MSPQLPSKKLRVDRLRNSVRAVEKEDRDLLVGLSADIHAPMNPFGGLVPIDLSRLELEAIRWPPVAVFDCQRIASENHRHAVKRIAMPRHGLPRRETETANENCSMLVQRLLDHYLNSNWRMMSSVMLHLGFPIIARYPLIHPARPAPPAKRQAPAASR